MVAVQFWHDVYPQDSTFEGAISGFVIFSSGEGCLCFSYLEILSVGEICSQNICFVCV